MTLSPLYENLMRVHKFGRNTIKTPYSMGPGVLINWHMPERPDQPHVILAPTFEVDGKLRDDFSYTGISAQATLANGGEELEFRYISYGEPELLLRVTFRKYFDSPFMRVRYRLTASAPCILTKANGKDNLTYLTTPFPEGEAGALTEISLSQFEPVLHSYLPAIETYDVAEAFAGRSFSGPVMVLESEQYSLLVAYEHGADTPNPFIRYEMRPAVAIPERFLDAEVHQEEVRRAMESKTPPPDADPFLALAAVRGNYYHGQPIGPDHAWESIWLELGMVPGGIEQLLPLYRSYLNDEMCPNPTTRKPLICYNTWNYQERNKLYNGRPYLESMNLERMLAEIDVAHRMGIDVFVIDTGWFDRPGDWQVNLQRFPDGLREVKRKLDGYGMQLGLWFNPLAAGLASQVYRDHPEYEMTWDGKLSNHWVVWETEESASMCLASDYADAFAQVMLAFRENLGVTYFKWDGIGQYGCNSPLHHHGAEANSPEERGDCYAFQMGVHMIKMIEAVTRRYPEVIVDFDATECGRFVGLGLLGAGRFFLINNGSYARDFDTPETLGIAPYMNMFFYPGPARARVCRRGSLFDVVVPSNLYLIHYLPDGPELSMRNSLASLVLGGNGIWGDLPALGEKEVRFWAENLADYKRVAAAASRAYPVMRGFVGASPEIHEKIDPVTGKGFVSFFTVTEGEFTHLTQPANFAGLSAVKGADHWEATPDGRIKITVKLGRDDARVVFLF
jgi:alpha-galactosidase